MGQPQLPQGEQRRYLVVRSGSMRYALPARAVRRILRAVPLTPVPGADRQLVGLGQLGGEPLVVLDLLAVLGASEEEAGTLEVTVAVAAGPGAGEIVGLAVDEALEVVTIAADAITACGGGPVRGEALVGEQVVRVLDLTALGREP